MKHNQELTYYFDVEQGTTEWTELRRGKATGSAAACLLVNGKKRKDGLGVGAVGYIYKKAGGMVACEDDNFTGNDSTQRGHDLEPVAVLAYEEEIFEAVESVGFIELDSYSGCSPDGLVGDDGIIEVKCPEYTKYMEILDKYDELIGSGASPDQLNLDALDKGYNAQIQFNLFVTDRDWCDFVCFHPKFGKKNLIIIRVFRNEVMIDKFAKRMEVFRNEMNRLLMKFN